MITLRRAARRGLLFFLLLSPIAAWAGTLRVTFFYCGQGDAALLQTPSGKVILMDAGPIEDWNDFDAGRDVLLPFFKKNGIQRIDAAVLSHAHLDHIGGLIAIADAIPIGEVVDPGLAHTTPEYQALLGALLEKKIPYRPAADGAVFQWDPELDIRVLNPPPGAREEDGLNDNSLVVRVLHGEVAFLFPGDVGEAAERRMVSRHGDALRSRVLKVPHHGSKTSSTDIFLETVDPRWAVISCGRRNRYNHPNPLVLKRYADRKIPLWRTDKMGSVEFTSDGKYLRKRKVRVP